MSAKVFDLDEMLPNGLIRQSLPIEHWPVELCDRWQTYCAQCETESDDLLADFVAPDAAGQVQTRSSRKTYMSQSSRDVTESMAGRWLLFAGRRQMSEVPTAGSYVLWLQFEKDRGIAPTTLATQAFRLWRFCVVVWPEGDWSWMTEIWQSLKKAAKPAKDKRPRVRNAHDIETLGFDLMNAAVREFERGHYRQRAAVMYRDGLMLAMWSQKPMRRANMAALSFSDFKGLPDGRIKAEMTITKNGDGDEAVFDEDIADAIEDWRRVFRPLLSPPEDCDQLWIGRLGDPMLPGGLYQACIYRTKQAFGISINPHLVRDCAARTIAEHSPEAAYAIGTLLGHRDERSSKHYLGQAMMIGGAAQLDEIWQDYRIASPASRKRPSA